MPGSGGVIRTAAIEKGSGAHERLAVRSPQEVRMKVAREHHKMRAAGTLRK